MQRKSFYNIQNGKTEADIFIYGAIGASFWENGVGADQFVKDFRALELLYDKINVHINSPGGSIHDGLPISNVIRASKKDIHTYVDGIAFSMASIIAISGKTVHMASNSMLMLHNASNWVSGNAKFLREAADELDKYDLILMQTISDKTGMSIDDIKSQIFDYNDHYYTATEAKEAGLCNVIESYTSEQIPDDVKNLSQEKVFKYYANANEEKRDDGIFKRVLNHFRDLGLLNKPKEEKTDNMDFSNSLNLLNKESLTAEDKTAIVNEIKNFTGANEKFTPEEVKNKLEDATKPLNEELTALKAEKKALEEKVATLEAAVPTPAPAPVRNGNDPVQEPQNDFRTSVDDELEAMKKL